jgi:hypothetical protein
VAEGRVLLTDVDTGCCCLEEQCENAGSRMGAPDATRSVCRAPVQTSNQDASKSRM